MAHFRQHLHDQHWREVLLLLVSKLKGKKAQKAIQAVLEAGSEYEQWLHRDLLFAGWCLTEGLNQVENPSKDIVSAFLSLLDNEDDNIRSNALNVLSRLENPSEDIVVIFLSLLGDKDSNIRLGTASALGRLGKTSTTICAKVLQWLEQNPNDDGIGSAIDCLWSIVFE